MSAQAAYKNLTDHFARIGALRAVSGILGWDAATMMPSGSAAARAEQQAALDVAIHEKLNDPRVQEWLATAEGESPEAKANLHEIRRDVVHATAVPADLVDAFARATSASEMVWRAARAENNFAALLPKLRVLLGLVRDMGQAKAEALGTSVYDALLDQFEPGGRSADIDVLFADLAAFLPDLTENVLAAQARRPAPLDLPGPFPVATQKALGERLMRALGFDFDRGRLDVSHHPFCGGAPGDVRITTRYNDDSFFPAMMGVLHETGHALYEIGLPQHHRGQPIGYARGMSLHESQSLLVEMQVSRSQAFLTFATPLIREAFGGSGPAWSVENLHAHATRVSRGLIRVNADEVTYPAHVILRYRLERALIDGSLDLADLPGAWRDGMQELVGITPPDDKDGCLQDIHWPAGLFGYFPTYTMGAMTAAQLYAAAQEAVPEIPDEIAKGNFAPLLGWLREKIHGLGSTQSTRDILIAATGAPLSVAPFRRHLERRYLHA
jgi:carboxypeptidase Taq